MQRAAVFWSWLPWEAMEVDSTGRLREIREIPREQVHAQIVTGPSRVIPANGMDHPKWPGTCDLLN